jgi:hypothetical protein
MVYPSMLVVTTDGEHLTCGGFSLGEIVCFGSLEFIADCFDSLSLSPNGNDSSIVFMEMSHTGSPPLCTILEDSIDEFYTTSSGEGSSGFPISRRRNMVTPHVPITTTLWPEDTPASQTIATVLLWLSTMLTLCNTYFHQY